MLLNSGSYASGSVAVLASFLDSFLDVLSGAIIGYSQMAAARHEPWRYPQGKQRLEPIGVILFATTMTLSSVQVRRSWGWHHATRIPPSRAHAAAADDDADHN